MSRALAWLGAIALALTGHFFDNDMLRGASALALFAALGVAAPGLLPAAIVIAALAGAIWFATGLGGMLAALPALIAAFVGWLFARTLRIGRRPLIARAIVAIDGPAQLKDAAVAMYARRLSVVWAAWQFALAACAALLALHARGAFAADLRLPSPRAFGLIGLPLAVACLFLGEFFLRPRLLPQAPRHRLPEFVHALVRHWPALLDDSAVAVAPEARCSAFIMTDSICEHFHIAASHPALPGHFPGDPVVPGVVLLERIATAAERGFGTRIAGLPQMKFLRLLRPHEHAELRIERSGMRAKFSIHHGQELIAAGTLELAP